MDRIQLLRAISFGARVAEEETNELESYFVETDQWSRIFKGDVDVVKGDKGAGKSAIYSLLTTKASELFDKRILLITAEEPRGTPVFKEIIINPPVGEAEFVGLWKLYLLTLIAQKFKEYGIENTASRELAKHLTDQGLLETKFDLRRLLKLASSYARRFFTPTLETSVTVDPNSGLHTFTGKITPGEPEAGQADKGFISVDTLAALAEQALLSADFQIWILLDRLDVAFAETHELEKNALRALFRVYRDFSGHDHIKLKIFLRSDIWGRIVDSGFREASHITKVVTLTWSNNSLLNLIVKRILKNKVLIDELELSSEVVLASFAAQSDLFYKLFPAQVDQGLKKPSTLDWVISRCADGTAKTAPREVIHLLNSLRDQEIARLEQGFPAAETIFDRSVFKEALPTVSEGRLVQNLFAEYPECKDWILKLKGEKTEQTLESLNQIWNVTTVTTRRAETPVQIGFFQRRGSRDDPTFWVPFLYRDALDMVQGLADEG
jgi:hypothetical protein